MSFATQFSGPERKRSPYNCFYQTAAGKLIPCFNAGTRSEPGSPTIWFELWSPGDETWYARPEQVLTVEQGKAIQASRKAAAKQHIPTGETNGIR